MDMTHEKCSMFLDKLQERVVRCESAASTYAMDYAKTSVEMSKEAYKQSMREADIWRAASKLFSDVRSLR